jgi:phosphoglycolate phosphatase-like HAD superfamily hydrolase
MPLSAEKRRFLVQHLGERRTKELEDHWQEHQKQQEEYVKAFKAKTRGDTVAEGILEDLRSLGRRQPSLAVVTAGKALRAQVGPGPYSADLLEGKLVLG